LEDPMPQLIYRYTLGASVPAEEVEVTLLLAIIATEALHGEVQSRLDVSHTYDPDRRVVAIDASTPAGRDLSKLLAGFLSTEFGADSCTVERIPHSQEQKPRPEVVTA
jgi:hypothetical protein